MSAGFNFNAPPGWQVPAGWTPPADWKPDPAWPPAPPDWVFWVPAPPPAPPVPPEAVVPTQVEEEEEPPPSSPVPSPPLVSQPDVGSDSETRRLRAEVDALRAELEQVRAASGEDLVDLDDERVLQDVGIYRYHHPLENSAEYRDQLRALQEEIKSMVKSRDAVLVSDMFTFNNSLAKGRRMTADLSKLMLRAYNAEADNAVRSLRAGNVVTAKKRVEASVAAIAKLGSIMEMRVSPEYHALRLREIELTADFLMKVQEEKEAERAERERLREERKAAQELEAERQRLEKERAHYANALEAARAGGSVEDTAELESKLVELTTAIEHNDYRIANIRAGYVYVISNPGAFGRAVVKIGMTRRLEPMDRVRELGDASVPFPYDVHALFFSDDAVTLEADLHRTFSKRRLNHVNERREFFFATPADVRNALADQIGSLLEFNEEPEATQYFQSRKYWPSDTDSR